MRLSEYKAGTILVASDGKVFIMMALLTLMDMV